MPNMQALREALKQRKSKGVDVTIILGSPEKNESEDNEKLGLAPDLEEKDSSGMDASAVDGTGDDLANKNNMPTTGENHTDEEQDKKLIKEMLYGMGKKGSMWNRK